MKKLKHKKVSDAFVITKQFHTASEFSQFIEKQAVTNGVDYMDCIIDFCHKNDIDVEAAGKLISKSLKEKIRTEATKKKMLTGKRAAQTGLF